MVKQITPDDVRKMLQQGGVSFPQTFGQAPKAPSLPRAKPIQQARYLDPMLSPSVPSFDQIRTTTPPIRQESTPSDEPSWGEITGTSLKTGATQAALAIPATADALGLEKRNFPFLPDLSWNRETISKARQEQQDMMSQIDTSTLGGKAKNLGASLIGTLPGMALDMGLIVATGGVSATPKLATTAVTTTSMAMQALSTIMKSPATANRITRYFAQSYNDSKDQGASSEDALRNAVLYAVPSAIIEASGGIDNVAMDIAKGTNKTTAWSFVKDLFLKTAPEEAREGMLQEIVGGASRKSTYEPNLPIFSTKEDAVVNPAQIAKAGAMEYAGGVILGGGMRTIQNARLPRFNPETTQQPVQPTPVQPTTEPIAQPPVMQTFRPTPDSLDAIRNRQAVEPMAEPTVETAQPYSAMELPQLENELAKINEKIAKNAFDSDADYRATGQAWQEVNALIKEKSQPTTAQPTVELARTTSVPNMSFDQYAESKGVKKSQLASDKDMADFIGGSIAETTKAGKGKVNALRKKVEFTQSLQEEYQQAIRNGEVDSTDRIDKLKWSNKSDQAYARMQIKRAKARGDNETADKWQSFYDNKFQQPTSGNDIDIKVRKEIENLAFEKAAAKLRIETFDGLGLLPPKNIRVKGMLRTDLYQNLQHQFEELVKIYEEQLSKDNSVRKTIIDKYNSLQARDEHARLVEESFAKEDWQVPQSIILERGGRYIDGKDVLLSHKESVAKALSEGEAVPGEVLADYPDLTPQSPTTDFAKPLTQEQTPIVDQTPTKENKSAEKPILNLQRFSGERPKYQAMLDTYGRMEQGENPARDVQVPNRTNPDTKVGKAYRTAMEAESTPGALAVDLKEEIERGAADYIPIGNAEVQKQVEADMINKGLSESNKDWDSVVRGNTAAGAKEIVLGEKLYVEAAKRGDYETAKKLVAEIALVARRAGQTVQAMRILKKLTPDGQLYYLNKVVDQLNKQHEKKLKGQTIKLSKEAQAQIMTAQTKKELDIAVDQAHNEIAKQIPNTLLDKLNAWRYLSMLGNFRTHIRNIVGNGLFMPVRGVKNLTGMVIEQAIPQDQRTKAILLPGIDKADTERLQFASKDFDEMADVITGSGKHNISDILRDKQQVFDTKILEWARKFNFDLLEKEDVFTLKLTYNSSLAQFMKARGLTPDTITSGQLNEARGYAVMEAQKATFRDPSKVAKWLSETSKRGTVANLAVEAIMPFKKTPANILKRGIEYSPAGLIKGLYDTLIKVPNGDMKAADAVDALASGLSGTAVSVLGVWLASLGIITGAGEEDDRLRAFDEMQGTQNYSLRVGDYYYSLDWAAPAAMPFFAGVEFFEALVRGGEQDPFTKAFDALTNMTEPAFNMSMLQGINSTIRSAQYSEQNEIASIAQNLVANYLSQYVPTLSGQIARTIDPVRRNAYYNDKNKNLPQSMQVALNRNIAKLPKANESLPAYIDQWGREERNDNLPMRAIENFISPGFVSKESSTKVDKALRELYDKTGDGTILPSKAPRHISVDGTNVYLTSKQYEKYAKEKGQTSYKYLEDLINNKEYTKLSDQAKTDLVKKAYEIANAEAKSKVTPYKLPSEAAKIKDAQKQGIKISDYLIIKATADTRGKDENGNYVNKPNNSIDQEEAYRRLEQTNLTAEQKQYLYFNAFNTQWKNLPKLK